MISTRAQYTCTKAWYKRFKRSAAAVRRNSTGDYLLDKALIEGYESQADSLKQEMVDYDGANAAGRAMSKRGWK